MRGKKYFSIFFIICAYSSYILADSGYNIAKQYPKENISDLSNQKRLNIARSNYNFKEPKRGAKNIAKYSNYTYHKPIDYKNPTKSTNNIIDNNLNRNIPIEETKDYKTIYKYITSKYKKVPLNEAHLIAKHLVEYGRANNMDPKFAAAVMARESSFNKNAVSCTGAKGLGQIKDFNYKFLRIKNPFDIKQNVAGTIQYLKHLKDKWKGKAENNALALASYFKGYGAIKRAGETYDHKTASYVKDILKKYHDLKSNINN